MSQQVAKEIAAEPTNPAELQAAYAKLKEQQSRIMELIGTTDARHLVHDIRNVLNERQLLRALVDLQEE